MTQRRDLVWTRVAGRTWECSEPGISFEIRCHGWRRFTLSISGGHPMSGDHPPAWTLRGFDEAGRKAAEIVASAPAPGILGGMNWPVVELDDPDRPLPRQPDKPHPMPMCRRCGSLEAVAVGPVDFTMNWWDNVDPYWRCETCAEGICLLDGTVFLY